MAGELQTLQGLAIPPSQHVVDVSVIDSTARISVSTGLFIKDPLPGHETLDDPAFVFLIQHPLRKPVLFDLGLRKDIESFPPVIRNGLAYSPMAAQKDIATILKEYDRTALDEIGSIIWSYEKSNQACGSVLRSIFNLCNHWHCDHIGDPSTFPPGVELVVGPGCKDALLPGYPSNPEGLILESDYAGRQLREVDFATGLRIGHFRAVDYFGDGSFYLLDSPGHAVGHVYGLARTTPATFIFMGVDGCHHTGSLRPNPYLPLPEEISPSPFSVPPYLEDTICPGALLQAIHPKHTPIEPYYSHLSPAPTRDVASSEAVIRKMIDFDASEDVLIIIAHDKSLLDV